MSNSKKNGIKVTSWPVIQKWVEANRAAIIEENERRRRINAMLAERHRKHQEQLAKRRMQRAETPTLLCHLVGAVSWRKHKRALIQGKLDPLPRKLAHEIKEASEWVGLKPLSAEFRISAQRMVIGLLAIADADEDRAAKAVADTIFKDVDHEKLNDVAVAMALRMPDNR